GAEAPPLGDEVGFGLARLADDGILLLGHVAARADQRREAKQGQGDGADEDYGCMSVHDKAPGGNGLRGWPSWSPRCADMAAGGWREETGLLRRCGFGRQLFRRAAPHLLRDLPRRNEHRVVDWDGFEANQSG